MATYKDLEKAYGNEFPLDVENYNEPEEERLEKIKMYITAKTEVWKHLLTISVVSRREGRVRRRRGALVQVRMV